MIKHIAASPSLLTHTGPAVVFDGYQDLKRRINDPDLPITADTVLVLRDAGPLGGPGMPEYGMLPIPDRLLAVLTLAAWEGRESLNDFVHARLRFWWKRKKVRLGLDETKAFRRRAAALKHQRTSHSDQPEDTD